METKTNKHTLKKVIVIIAAIMLIFSTITSFAVIGIAFGGISGFGFGGFHLFTKEDNVTIGGQYEILPTTQISDAYISGDTSSLSDEDKETLEMASKIISQNVTEDMSVVEKERAIYDWMRKNIEIDEGTLTLVNEDEDTVDNPHGVLKYGKAVCVGYATTFRMFMQMMDIPCKVVHDDYKGHSWDLVQIEDDWYHVDIYSAVVGDPDYYFNAPDSVMSDDGQEWDTGYFPTATSVKYYAPFQNRVEVEDIYSIPSEVRKILGDESNSVCFEFKNFPDDEEYDTASLMVDAISDAIAGDYDGYLNYSWISQDDTDYFFVSYSVDSDEEVGDINGGTERSANRALKDAFGDLYEDISLNY